MRWMKPLFACLVLCLSLSYGQGKRSYKPEQIHLAYGDTVREIVVTWSTNETLQGIAGTVVKYHTQIETRPRNEYVKYGTADLFVDEGELKRSQYIHRVVLDDLKPGRSYEYHVGSRLGWSDVYWFRTPPEDLINWSPQFAVYGDLGYDNAQSVDRLIHDTQAGMYDAILHVGDFAYDFETDNGTKGDNFMRLIEGISAYVPYMVCPGNHEASYNFSHYKNRFSMPGRYENLFYSINIGPVHLISLTTEVYYENRPDLKPLDDKQYAWLKQDLAKATKPDKRDLQPWILTMGHRPMYCSNGDDPDYCLISENPVRIGVYPNQSLENLFYRNEVDIEIWAHEHTYERLWPVFNNTVYNGSMYEPYVNPRAPVHLITGSAGCVELKDNFTLAQPDWSAFRSTDYGYTRLKVFNKTHLRFQQVSDDQDGEIIDEWWVVRNFPRMSYPLQV